jgi:hypothetical protein
MPPRGHPVWVRDRCLLDRGRSALSYTCAMRLNGTRNRTGVFPLVEPAGFEPATPSMPWRCATRLRQGPKVGRPCRSSHPGTKPGSAGTAARSLGPDVRGLGRPVGVNNRPPLSRENRQRASGFLLARCPVQDRLATTPAFNGRCSPGVAALSFTTPKSRGRLAPCRIRVPLLRCQVSCRLPPSGLSPVSRWRQSSRTSRDRRSRTPGTRVWNPLLYH